MNYAELRRITLWTFIGFLVLTALVAIISVLIGEFGEIQAKILGTCLAISACSICAMACAAFMEKRKATKLGLAGIALSVGWSSLAIIGMWAEIHEDEYWKTVATLAVCAVAFAHGFLLLLPELARRHRWIQVTTLAFIGILAAQIVIGMWAEIDDETYLRLLTVVAIMVVLGTLVVPILMKFGQGAKPRNDRLVLRGVGGELFEDASGRRYRVSELDAGEESQAAVP